MTNAEILGDKLFELRKKFGLSQEELAERLRPLNAHVNLIPVNKVEEREYKKGTRDEINSFSKYLNDCGVNATIRRELGADISASCGQLRKKTANISE